MKENRENCLQTTEWQQAWKRVIFNGGAMCTSFVLMKYFNKRHFNTNWYTKHYQLADVLCKIIWMGYCHEKEGTLLPGGYFQENSKSISEGLGIRVRTTREIANLLQTIGLIDIKRSNRKPNCYRVNFEVLKNIIDAVLYED